MTNNAAIILGAVLTTAFIPGAQDVAQVSMTLTGGALLTWIALMQGREIKALRAENRDLNRELGKKCANCELARQANRMLTGAGDEYMHDQDQHDTES